MRVLVSGASGHVGGAIARRLIAEGHSVVGLGRRAVDLPGLESVVQDDLGAPGLVQRVDATSGRCDAVVHAAASLDKDPRAASVSLVNGLGTHQMIGLAEMWSVSALVYVSGLPVIGSPRALPITEDHPTEPLTAYHASKLYGEHLVRVACARGIPAAILRLTSPVGPGTPDGRILTVFVRRAISGEPLILAGAGGRRQDYVDVRDIAAAALVCVETGAQGRFNVAAGVSHSNRELAERCVALLGSTSPIELSGEPDPDEEVHWDVSIERARSRLGWSPRHTLDEAILAAATEAIRD